MNQRLTGRLTALAVGLFSIACALRCEAARPATADAEPKRATSARQDAYRRARLWSERGRGDLALAAFDEALALDPNFAAALNGRGNEYFRSGDYPRAIANYNQALLLEPRSGVAYCNRAGAWLMLGEAEIAIDDYSEAIERRADYAPAYFGRASAQAAQGQYAPALADYRQAIRLDPQFAAAYENLAWLLASAPASARRNGRQAVELAARACELTGWRQSEPIATLAAACAESRDFDGAIHWQRRAIELAPGEQRLQDRLITYLARRPFHSQPSLEL